MLAPFTLHLRLPLTLLRRAGGNPKNTIPHGGLGRGGEPGHLLSTCVCGVRACQARSGRVAKHSGMRGGLACGGVCLVRRFFIKGRVTIRLDAFYPLSRRPVFDVPLDHARTLTPPHRVHPFVFFFFFSSLFSFSLPRGGHTVTFSTLRQGVISFFRKGRERRSSQTAPPPPADTVPRSILHRLFFF